MTCNEKQSIVSGKLGRRRAPYTYKELRVSKELAN
jgi:hypothetical protein